MKHRIEINPCRDARTAEVRIVSEHGDVREIARIVTATGEPDTAADAAALEEEFGPHWRGRLSAVRR